MFIRFILIGYIIFNVLSCASTSYSKKVKEVGNYNLTFDLAEDFRLREPLKKPRLQKITNIFNQKSKHQRQVKILLVKGYTVKLSSIIEGNVIILTVDGSTGNEKYFRASELDYNIFNGDQEHQSVFEKALILSIMDAIAYYNEII